MALLKTMRRVALREELSIREISRPTGLSRNTIKKHLSAGNRTLQLNIVDPQACLVDTLARIPDYKITRVDGLLPWNVAQGQSSRTLTLDLPHE